MNVSSMRKRKGRAAVVVCAALAAVLLLVWQINSIGAAKAQEQTLPVYESFDDYDTKVGRDGQRTALEQMLAWSDNMMGFVCETGDPVGVDTGKSLKLTRKNSSALNAWSNGTMDPDLLDQSGAKYVRVNVRNLSTSARELIVYVTDILQETIDANRQSGSAVMNDDGQEHWAIRFNKSAVLQPFGGEMTAVKSTLGASVAVPAGFEGYLYLPLDTETLGQPGWWLAENHTYKNDKIDLERLFMVSFGFPTSGAEDASDPATWTVFELDEVSFGRDTTIDEFLAKEQEEEALSAADVIRPATDEGLTIDHQNKKITLTDTVTVSAFKAMFSLTQDFTVSVKRGTVTLSNFEKIPDGCTAEFTNGVDSFTYEIVLEKPAPQEEAKAGCGGSLTATFNGIALVVVAGALIGILALKKKRAAGK